MQNFRIAIIVQLKLMLKLVAIWKMIWMVLFQKEQLKILILFHQFLIILIIYWKSSGIFLEEYEEEESPFGGPKPMVPFSSMFLFSPTNP